MAKEQVFKSIEKTVEESPNFKEAKENLDREHKAIQDKIAADKQAELDRFRGEGREPIVIEQLDERKAILSGQRVPKIQPVQQLQQNLNLRN